VPEFRDALMRARDILARPQASVSEAYEIQHYFEPAVGDLVLSCYVEDGELQLQVRWPSNKLAADISSVSPTLRASYLLIGAALQQVMSLEPICHALEQNKS
jgi:hypothetical protein